MMERDQTAFWVVQVLTQSGAFGKQIALVARTSSLASKDAGFLHVGLRNARQRGQRFWIEGSRPSLVTECKIKDEATPEFKSELRHFRARVSYSRSGSTAVGGASTRS